MIWNCYSQLNWLNIRNDCEKWENFNIIVCVLPRVFGFFHLIKWDTQFSIYCLYRNEKTIWFYVLCGPGYIERDYALLYSYRQMKQNKQKRKNQLRVEKQIPFIEMLVNRECWRKTNFTYFRLEDLFSYFLWFFAQRCATHL